jgi:hypothetical protein
MVATYSVEASDLVTAVLRSSSPHVLSVLLPGFWPRSATPARKTAASQDAGVPEAHVVTAAKLALGDEKERADLLLVQRLNVLGRKRVHELLDNPAELERLANLAGVDLAVVTKQATAFVGRVEIENKVPDLLLQHAGITDVARAANEATNEAPGYKTLKLIARDLKKDLPWVRQQVELLRPTENRGHTLKRLLENDVYAQGDLPDVATVTLGQWAKATGADAAFLAERCRLIHKQKERVKAKKEKEEAERAKAKAEREAKMKSMLEAAAAAKAATAAKAKAVPAKPVAEADDEKATAAVPTAPQQPKPAAPMPGTRPARPAEDVDPGLLRSVRAELSALLIEDNRVWEAINDFPDYGAATKVAKLVGAPLEDVLDAMEACRPDHPGKTRLLEAFRKLGTETALALASNKGDSDVAPISTMLNQQTGLGLGFIEDRLEEWIDAGMP